MEMLGSILASSRFVMVRTTIVTGVGLMRAPTTAWYADADEDGYGNGALVQSAAQRWTGM